MAILKSAIFRNLTGRANEAEWADLNVVGITFAEHAQAILALVLCAGHDIVVYPEALETMLPGFRLVVTDDQATGSKTYRAGAIE